jgi:hypothetical protein
MIPHDIREALEVPGTVPTDPGDGRRRQLHLEEVRHQGGKTLLGQQLVVQKVQHERSDPRAILHRRSDAIRERRAGPRAAVDAVAIVRTMFGDDEGVRFGQIEHLTGVVTDARFRLEAPAARRAGRRVMVHDDIGVCDLPQGLPFVTLLPARFPARTFPQAPHPRRLLQPIARRRLAAIRTVQPEPALEFGYPRPQSRILDLQCRYPRERVFRRGHVRRFATHLSLESDLPTAVQEILPPIFASPIAQPGLLRISELNRGKLVPLRQIESAIDIV